MRIVVTFISMVCVVLTMAGMSASAMAASDKLEIKELKVGTGDEAVRNARVEVHYTGWLMDGTKFDSSVDRGDPFSFTLDRGEVISGWDQGVVGMRVGGKRELIIPPMLAYGERGAGGLIPGNATLRFEVELLAVAAPKYANIDSAELAELLKTDAVLIDIRTKHEWAETGIVENSHLLTAFDEKGRFSQSFPSELRKLVKKNKPLILICRTGNRTAAVADFLSNRMGYKKVYNVENGIKRWIKDGQPVVKP